MKKIFVLFSLLLSLPVFAQQPGFIPNKYGQSYGDDAPLRFGNDLDAWLEFDSGQTNDALFLGLNSSNYFLVGEKADMGFNFAHTSQTNPTLFVHSHNQSANQWISMTHDGTNGVISVGTGAVSFPGGISAPISGSDNITTTGVITGGSFVSTGNITSTATTNLGWSVVAGANTACNTTCTNACVFGQNTADMTIVNCAAATADVCVCAGAN